MTTTYAYRSFKGKRRDGTIVNGIIPQFDGSPMASTNCGTCSEGMRDVSQQKGARPSKGTPWQPTGAALRAKTYNADGTLDKSGGTNPSQTTAATRRLYGLATASPRIGTFAEVLAKLDAGYAVDLLVGYGPIDDYRSGSPGFTGNHRVVLVGRNVTSTGKRLLDADPLYDGRRSGIPLGQQWLPQSVLLTAAGQLRVEGTKSLDASHGPGRAYYIPSLTRLVVLSYRAAVPASRFWRYYVTNGVITGRKAYTTGGFSGTCTDDREYDWPEAGKRYRLVQMTGGAYRGWYIHAVYSNAV